MDPPVVEHLRQMSRPAGLFDEAEEEVVVLTAVAGGRSPPSCSYSARLKTARWQI
ncbi:MAG: hypothetical protein ACLUIR_02350 [Faecalibacterium prausnitzii]